VPARLGSADVGWDEAVDKWGPHVSEGERKGTVDGRRNPKKKTHLAE
jgi:hypothetical protein